jgi:hypothetical protein
MTILRERMPGGYISYDEGGQPTYEPDAKPPVFYLYHRDGAVIFADSEGNETVLTRVNRESARSPIIRIVANWLRRLAERLDP